MRGKNLPTICQLGIEREALNHSPIKLRSVPADNLELRLVSHRSRNTCEHTHERDRADPNQRPAENPLCLMAGSERRLREDHQSDAERDHRASDDGENVTKLGQPPESSRASSSKSRQASIYSSASIRGVE